MLSIKQFLGAEKGCKQAIQPPANASNKNHKSQLRNVLPPKAGDWK